MPLTREQALDYLRQQDFPDLGEDDLQKIIAKKFGTAPISPGLPVDPHAGIPIVDPLGGPFMPLLDQLRRFREDNPGLEQKSPGATRQWVNSLPEFQQAMDEITRSRRQHYADMGVGEAAVKGAPSLPGRLPGAVWSGIQAFTPATIGGPKAGGVYKVLWEIIKEFPSYFGLMWRGATGEDITEQEWEQIAERMPTATAMGKDTQDLLSEGGLQERLVERPEEVLSMGAEIVAPVLRGVGLGARGAAMNRLAAFSNKVATGVDLMDPYAVLPNVGGKFLESFARGDFTTPYKDAYKPEVDPVLRKYSEEFSGKPGEKPDTPISLETEAERVIKSEAADIKTGFNKSARTRWDNYTKGINKLVDKTISMAGGTNIDTADVGRQIAIGFDKHYKKWKAESGAVLEAVKNQIGHHPANYNHTIAKLDEILEKYSVGAISENEVDIRRVQTMRDNLAAYMGQAETTPTVVSGQPIEGQPYEFDSIRNTEPAPNMGARYGQDIEPAGVYMTEGPSKNIQGMPNMVADRVRFENPLVIEWGEGYGQAGNWKNVLSQRFDGKTGAELSDAVAAAGYDGIVTFDGSGTSEIVDLRTRVTPTAVSDTTDVPGGQQQAPSGEGRIYYHQTTGTAASQIAREGFSIDYPQARLSDDRLPDGVYMKSSESDIMVGGTGDEAFTQVPVQLPPGSTLEVDTVSDLHRLLSPEYHQALKESMDFDAATAREFDEVWKGTYTDGELEQLAQKYGIDISQIEPTQTVNGPIIDIEDAIYNKILDGAKPKANKLAADSRRMATQELTDMGYDYIYIKEDKGNLGRTTDNMIVLPHKIEELNKTRTTTPTAPTGGEVWQMTRSQLSSTPLYHASFGPFEGQPRPGRLGLFLATTPEAATKGGQAGQTLPLMGISQGRPDTVSAFTIDPGAKIFGKDVVIGNIDLPEKMTYSEFKNKIGEIDTTTFAEDSRVNQKAKEIAKNTLNKFYIESDIPAERQREILVRSSQPMEVRGDNVVPIDISSDPNFAPDWEGFEFEGRIPEALRSLGYDAGFVRDEAGVSLSVLNDQALRQTTTPTTPTTPTGTLTISDLDKERSSFRRQQKDIYTGDVAEVQIPLNKAWGMQIYDALTDDMYDAAMAASPEDAAKLRQGKLEYYKGTQKFNSIWGKRIKALVEGTSKRAGGRYKELVEKYILNPSGSGFFNEVDMPAILSTVGEDAQQAIKGELLVQIFERAQPGRGRDIGILATSEGDLTASALRRSVSKVDRKVMTDVLGDDIMELMDDLQMLLNSSGGLRSTLGGSQTAYNMHAIQSIAQMGDILSGLLGGVMKQRGVGAGIGAAVGFSPAGNYLFGNLPGPEWVAGLVLGLVGQSGYDAFRQTKFAKKWQLQGYTFPETIQKTGRIMSGVSPAAGFVARGSTQPEVQQRKRGRAMDVLLGLPYSSPEEGQRAMDKLLLRNQPRD